MGRIKYSTIGLLGITSGISALGVALGGCMGDIGQASGEDESRSGEEVVSATSQALELQARRHRIAGGSNHGVAIRQDGTVWTWGYNQNGQLGNGGQATQLAPNQVTDPNIVNVVSVSAGGSTTMALKSDGTIWGWGYNSYGQIGDGSVNQTLVPKKTAGITDVVSIASGLYTTFALKSDGTVCAWGYNGYGQLGNGTTDGNAHISPSQVKTSPNTVLTGVVAIASGTYHAMALRFDGTVWAWGYNAYGQIGDGTVVGPKTYATQVSNLGGQAIAIGAGQYHSAALLGNGTVKSWGYGGNGQLGNNQLTNSAIPVTAKTASLVDITGVKGLAVGYRHTIALKSDGTTVAWGYDSNGQLGNDGTLTNSSVAVQVASLSGAEEVAAGAYFSMAISGSAGGIQGWGANANGELGDNTNVQKATPTTTLALSGQVEVALGDAHTIALKWDGTVWGYGQNTQGQLGDGSTIRRLTQSQMKINAAPTFLDKVIAVSAGSQHTLALRSDGTVWASGDHDFGQCGDGAPSASNRLYAVQVMKGSGNALTGIVAVAAGNYHSMALGSDGSIWTWGKNDKGQLGLADGMNQNTGYATFVPFLSAPAIAIAAGGSHSVAVLADGSAYAWGDDEFGQLCDFNSGMGVYSDAVSQIPDVTSSTRSVVSVAAGVWHTLMLMSDGSAFACGRNASGQLGNGDANDQISPVQVAGLQNAIRIAAGGSQSLAMVTDGSLYAWGANNYGQLGNGNSVAQNPIGQIEQLSPATTSNWTGIAMGLSHSAAVKPDGKIWTWGRNHQGQLGNGTFNANLTVAPTVCNFVL